MKVSTRAMVGVIAASALIAPLALATSAQAAPKAGKSEGRSNARAEAPRTGGSSERQTPKPSCTGGTHHSDDDHAAPVVQLPA